jgi:hypothetical protein
VGKFPRPSSPDLHHHLNAIEAGDYSYFCLDKDLHSHSIMHHLDLSRRIAQLFSSPSTFENQYN